MVSSVAVLWDIHGVLPALDRVLAEPAIQQAEIIAVTGDHSWGPRPTQVLDRLRLLGSRVVLIRGNADRELLHMSRGIDGGLGDDLSADWGAAQLTADHQLDRRSRSAPGERRRRTRNVRPQRRAIEESSAGVLGGLCQRFGVVPAGSVRCIQNRMSGMHRIAKARPSAATPISAVRSPKALAGKPT